MSTERLQTIIDVSLQGVDRSIAEARRLSEELGRAVQSAGRGSGFTPLSALAGATTGRPDMNPDRVQPGAFNPVERAQSQQLIATRNANNALQKLDEVYRKRDATAQEIFKAEQGALRAGVALDAAIERNYKVQQQFDPVLQQRLAAEKASAALAKQRNAAQQKQVMDDARATERARESLDRQRNAALQKQVMDDAREQDNARRSLSRQRDRALAKQVADEERARQESERRAATALTPEEVSKITASPLRQPGDTDRVYKAREILAEATNRHALAEGKLADATHAALTGDASSRTQLRAALTNAANAHSTSARSVAAAEQGLATAIRNEALVHAQNTRRSIREDFITGFRGRGQNPAPYGEQIGQALKFSVFYGTAYKALFALTQTLQATFQEGVAFQQGMTDLSIATGRPKAELDKIANDLAASSIRAGFAPSQGIEIGARSLGLYGVTDADQQIQDRVMSISSRVVNQLAVGSGKQPVDLQGDIAAIAQALGGGAAAQYRIADLDAYMTKKFGVQQGSTLDIVGQSASVGKAAGFTDEQLFAIAADLLSRTGQSGSAVSGYMAQIFSRGGEGSLVDVAKKQGIDPNQDLSKILEELARMYATSDNQATISAAFGRGKVQNAAVALLTDYNEVLSRADKSRTEAAGQADQLFGEHMKDIGGQLQLLQGALRDFASQLGESGLLDVVGLSIITFRELLEAANGLLRIWNALPNAAQDVIVALGLLAAATRSGAVGRIGNAALESAALGGQFRRTATGVPVYVNEAGQAARLASREGIGGLARAGRAALTMIGPIGLAIGGLLAIGEVKSSIDRMRTAQDAATDALLSPAASGSSSPAELRTAAAELTGLANDNRSATSGFFNALTFGQANNDNIATARRLEAEAARLEALATRAETNQAAIPTPDASAFRSFDPTDISTGLQMIQDSGGTATEQLAALRDVLYGTADAADAAKVKFDPKEFAGRAASRIQQGLADLLSGDALDFTGTTGYAANQFVQGGASRLRDPNQRISYKGNDLRQGMTAALTGPDAQARLAAGMEQLGIDSETDIDPDTAAQLGGMIGKGVARKILAPYTDDPKTIRRIQRQVNRYISDSLLAQTQDVRALASGDSVLSDTEATALANDFAAASENRLAMLPETDSRGRINELRQRIRDLTRTRSRSSEPNARIQQLLTEARRNISQIQFNELENLRRIAQRNASSKKEIAQIGMGFLRREINAAVRGGNADLLVQILEASGKGAVEIARKAIEDSLTVIAQARKVAAELADFGNQVNGVVQGAAASWRIQGEAASDGKKFKLNLPDTSGLLDAIKNVQPSRRKDNNYLGGWDSGNPLLDPESEQAKKDRDTAAEIAAARAAAYATRSESQIAAARASIQSARASLATAKKNTVEYWNAMGELFAAQNQLTDAVQAYRVNQMRLRTDMTNPLAQARIAVREAAMRLRSDRGKGADVQAADRVALREAQANRESTAFSQRLQAVQTADELGRISHTKYLNYLHHEKNRLEAIKNRTFQQQDQLNQIDRLMQDAAKQMQGQFNLGDIKLPTPYQVRRYIEQTSPSKTERMGKAAQIAQTNLTMYVDGADTAKVTTIVKDIVTKAGRVRTPAPRRN